jgi:CMP-N,N'-diacetyllegionaminic acid synthase
MKVLGLIPARGGSKGVPEKNIKELAGKPLIAYTIEAAMQSGVFADIFISTDDEKIAAVSKNYGIEIPLLRPAALATDTTPMLDVIRHVIDYYQKKNIQFDAICLLQPTCPFRRSSHIKEAVLLFEQNGYDSLISVQELPQKYNPHWVFIEKKPGELELFTKEKQPISRRQDLPNAFIREGSIYIFRQKTLDLYQNIYGNNIGYFLMRDESVNVDSMEDFTRALQLMSKLQSEHEL